MNLLIKSLHPSIEFLQILYKKPVNFAVNNPPERMNGIINLRVVLKVISRTLFIASASLIVCGVIALHYKERTGPFIIPSTIALILAVLFYLSGRARGENGIINRREAYLMVTFSWILTAITGCLPYIISGSIPSFIDAFFESMSGFTTTGSSILTDIESLPKSVLLWRSMTHWIGGIGIIVLVIVIMPALQIGGYHLFTMESSLQEKIQPKIKSVGKRLLLIYILLTLLAILLLLAGGMNLFESVCHSFGAISTGGFSPKHSSIAFYSPYIQYVIMVIMLLGGINFVIHYNILKGKFNKVRENEEFKFHLLIVFAVGMIITGVLFFKLGKPLEESFRESFFQVISIITCTGFSTTDYLEWPVFAWLILFVFMFLGGSTGSTAGGIKIARHIILVKNIKRIFIRWIYPDAVISIKLNKNHIDEGLNSSIVTFIMIYLLIFVSGSILMVIIGSDGKTACGAVATCMAGIGPGIGSVGPANNFSHIPESGKILLTFLMLIGRLEIYTVVVLMSRNFWRV